MSSHSALYSKLHTQITNRPLIARMRAHLYDPLRYWLARWFLATRTFSIGSNTHHYLVDWYNFTWMNERAIEIPFFIDLFSQHDRRRTLEIGNTLSHYCPTSHLIVDKYEPGVGVKNIDVLDFSPKKTFDCIFAISTIEHIGWHESEHRAIKAIEAIGHLRKMLSDTGTLTISFPIGVNPALDKALRTHSLDADELQFLRRKNWLDLWEIARYEDVRAMTYNHPFPNANAICIARFGPIPRRAAKQRGSAVVKKISLPTSAHDARF